MLANKYKGVVLSVWQSKRMGNKVIGQKQRRKYRRLEGLIKTSEVLEMLLRNQYESPRWNWVNFKDWLIDWWLIIYLLCVSVSLRECVPQTWSTYEDGKRVSDTLNLAVQIVVTYPTWMLGINSESSARTASALTPAPPLQLAEGGV